MVKVYINGGSVIAATMLRDEQVGLFPHTKDAQEAIERKEVFVDDKLIENDFYFYRSKKYTVKTKEKTVNIVLI